MRNLARRGLLKIIDDLTAENRRHRDPEIEARLVELRRDAGVYTGRSRSTRSWPPQVRDRFRRSVGLPEVTPDYLTPQILRSAIFCHGCLLVRGLVRRERVDQLVYDIDRAFSAYDDHAQGAQVSETAPWYVPFEPAAPFHDNFIPRPWLRRVGAVLVVDSPRALFDVIETFEELGLPALVTKFLCERPVLLAMKWTLRRQTVTENLSDWHQDGAFLGRAIRSINVWISLSHCGVDAPGLDIVARRFEDIVPTGTDGANFDWSVGHGMVERITTGEIVRPVFEPGDALLLDHMLLHRTGVDPGMTLRRHAIEAWFASTSTYPADHIPIAY